MNRTLFLVTLSLLYILRFDFWFWRTPVLILGLPVGLLYHFVFCFLVAVVFALILRLSRSPDLPADETDL